jgi:hypothetical protein
MSVDRFTFEYNKRLAIGGGFFLCESTVEAISLKAGELLDG